MYDTEPAFETTPPFVVSTSEHGLWWLSLNRPKSINALSSDMIAAIHGELETALAQNSTKVIVISGGDRGFCAGHDLKEINAHRADIDGGRAFYEGLFASCTAMMMAIRNADVPVIAMVDGISTAAGCQMMATCDMVISSDRSRFGVNGIDAGLFCSTPMVALSRDIPQKAAMEMLTSGTMIDAHRAERLGLINRVVAAEALKDETEALALKIAARSKAVVGLGKKAFYEQAAMSLEDAYAHTSKVIVDNLMMDDACEGIQAFTEKRKPEWPSEKP
ncbi:MAG: enoyl-CoA hydratase [Pseudomonadota bacterium]